jgi:MFS transporter, PPP family, 3-phenylpropionic acid transporter
MKKFITNVTGFNLLMINAFIYIAFSFYTSFLSPYFAKAGMNALEIGILLTIGPVTAILIQPIWAIISDRTGRRKDILSLVVLGSALSMFSYYIGNNFISFFIATLLLSIFSTSIVPLSDAIIIRIANKYQLAFSKIRLGGTVGFAFMVNIAGIFVRMYPPLQFTLGFIGYMILFIFVRNLPKEENESPKISIKKAATVNNKVILENNVTGEHPKGHRGILSIFQTKQVIFVLAFAFISQVGLSFYYSFVGVYMVELGQGEGMIGLANCISALSEIPVLLLINFIIRKLTPIKIIIISSFIMGLRLLAIFGGSLPYVFLGQILHGVTYMTIYISCATFINEYVRPGKQSQGQSMLAIIQTGIGSIIGNIAGGVLVDQFGIRSAYLYMSVLISIAVTIIVLIQSLFHNKMKLNATLDA